MTIDERIEKLTERHEALAQTVELLAAESRQTTANLNRLVGVVEQLALLVRDHEGRIRKLEGG